MSDYDFTADFDYDYCDAPTGEAVQEIETNRQLKTPKLHARKDARRVKVNGLKRQALTELIPELPPPDTDLYIIGNGSGAEVKHGLNPSAFDFGSFVPVLVGMLGNSKCKAYISTWTLNRDHALTMLELLDNGNIDELVFFSDPYLQKRNPSIAATLINGIQKHPDRARILFFKNHAKIIAIANADESQTVVVSGSANMSSQPRVENYVLTTAPEVYRFFVDEFFNAMLRGGKKNGRA